MNEIYVPTRRRHTGWTAEKQRRFIENLAITGSVRDAAISVFMNARSAYHLRAKPENAAFSRAWDMALAQCGGRLLSVAFDRALEGGVRRVWKDQELVVEQTEPSDRVLMWLISRIGPAPFRTSGDAALPTIAQIAELLPQFSDDLPDQPNLQNEDLLPEIPASPQRGEEP